MSNCSREGCSKALYVAYTIVKSNFLTYMFSCCPYITLTGRVTGLKLLIVGFSCKEHYFNKHN